MRFNLSKYGVAVSAGVKGARRGIDAKGKKYLHLGRGGIYYRQTLEDGLGAETEAQAPVIRWTTLLVVLTAFLLLYWISLP